MRKAYFKKYQLRFIKPVLTSRGGMKVKNGYYLFIEQDDIKGVGECSFIEGLSRDDLVNYENALHRLCRQIESSEANILSTINASPSIQFGYECALLDFNGGGKRILFQTDFTTDKQQIPINGLVWMGSKEFMLEQIEKKLEEGFKCIKIKVGAIEFEQEVMLLRFIRNKFPADVIEIRLDANGAFEEDDVFHKLEVLSAFNIHSIEQPIKPLQYELLKKVCTTSPIPIALDEELISFSIHDNKSDFLDFIKPAFIILKPSLVGGFDESEKWIQAAEKNNIQWWATSALESNIGLNAIAQWVATKNNSLVQGLGTGGLYLNNIFSPLYISGGKLGYHPTKNWEEIPV